MVIILTVDLTPSTFKRCRVGVLGIGGGGDVASSYVLCKVLEDIFDVSFCIPIAVLWERWIVDPTPGPVPKSIIRNADVGNCVYVTGDSYVDRGTYRFKPQAAILASMTNDVVPAVTLEYGVEGYCRCLDELFNRYKLDYVIGLDVGGDILAEGWEESLWSPLTDAMGLAALSKYRSIIAVLGPGADGELPQEYVLSRVSDVARNGGYIGSIGLWTSYIKLLEDVTSRIETEASKIPLLALKGFNGIQPLRGGLRKARVNVISTTIFLLKTDVVYGMSKLAMRLINTRNLSEAIRIAEDLGVITEFHSELRRMILSVRNKLYKPRY